MAMLIVTQDVPDADLEISQALPRAVATHQVLRYGQVIHLFAASTENAQGTVACFSFMMDTSEARALMREIEEVLHDTH